MYNHTYVHAVYDLLYLHVPMYKYLYLGEMDHPLLCHTVPNSHNEVSAHQACSLLKTFARFLLLIEIPFKLNISDK